MVIQIRETEFDVDISEELEPYMDNFYKARTRGNKLQCCSPFRHEKTPSFAVNLETGVWVDSGATDDTWYKGNFIKLLSFLMAVTYSEAEEYLWEKYRTIYSDVDNWVLDVKLPLPKEPITLPHERLKPYLYRNIYLTNRGITEQVQRAFKIGYDRENKAVVIPWFDKKGNLINFKFRSITDKRFWYLEDGHPLRDYIYGLHFIFRMNCKKVFVVESETDALYLWSHGIPAIALGRASMSAEQEKQIINSPIEVLVLAFDKDSAGLRCTENVKKRLMGKVVLWEMPIPHGCKDVNNIPPNFLIATTEKSYRVLPTFIG